MGFAALLFYWGEQGVFGDGVRRAGGICAVRGSAEPGGAAAGPGGHKNLTLVYCRLLSNQETRLCKYSNGHVMSRAYGYCQCTAQVAAWLQSWCCT